MSSSPWEWLWNGNEDVATPFHLGAVSISALFNPEGLGAGSPGSRSAPREWMRK